MQYLFACFESLRGSRRAAVIRIVPGLNLLLQMEDEAKNMWNAVLSRAIRALFTRLDSQVIEILGWALVRHSEDGI